MRASQFFITTYKEAPADAEVVSHRLMVRAGMIRRLGSGIYAYMPMGLRVIRKIENIIREEMDRSGAVELLMPIVQPAELWQETGRWQKYGPELLRIKDRHNRDFIIQPTSEEMVTDIARNTVRSYRQLPVNFYHIQTKFRDERRPRFGLMRGREFTMKDAYSFDTDIAGMQKSYQNMFDTYVRIFSRFGLTFRAVAADNGSIGGTGSHEFHVIADTGEDALVYSTGSDYAANMEAAVTVKQTGKPAEPTGAMEKVATPGQKACADVSAFLNLPVERSLKLIAVVPVNEDGEKNGNLSVILMRGDHELNEVKTEKIVGSFRFAGDAEIIDAFGCEPGYLGPVGLKDAPGVDIYCDEAASVMSDFICGANEKDFHYKNANWNRDIELPSKIADFRNVTAGEPSPDGKGVLAIQRGIEVGHVFQLGTTYSKAMNAVYLDENGQNQLMQMGCYGIGVTRVAAAAIEQNHDDKGMFWPVSIAPFELVVCPLGYDRNEAVKETADRLYDAFKKEGIDVIIDDRGERPGVMFADWELVGIPFRIVVGDRGLKAGTLEIKGRRDEAATEVKAEDAVAYLVEKIKAART